jgi:hypothetical protein
VGERGDPEGSTNRRSWREILGWAVDEMRTIASYGTIEDLQYFGVRDFLPAKSLARDWENLKKRAREEQEHEELELAS